MGFNGALFVKYQDGSSKETVPGLRRGAPQGEGERTFILPALLYVRHPRMGS